MLRAEDIMTGDCVGCTSYSSLDEVARLMVENDCGFIPVFESEDQMKLAGVITDRDILCRSIALGENPLELTAEDCMSTRVVTVRPEASLEEVCQKMERHKIRRVIVVDNEGSCAGVISQGDLARHGPAKRVAEVLQRISQPGTVEEPEREQYDVSF